MIEKPVLLYYCQQTGGLCGLVRAFAIANRLARRFRVVIVNGGLLPPGTSVPASIELVQLPPLRSAVDKNDFDVKQQTATPSEIAVRRDMILETNKQLEPRVILLETFPFGALNSGNELTPLIEGAGHRSITRPLIISSVLDILPRSGDDRTGDDDRTAALLNSHFDTVIVHSDPLFARLEEFHQPRNALTTPVYHSGFVARDRNPLPRSDQREKRILVSAGSGITGGTLFRVAVEAHRLIWGVDQLPMTIIAGPCLPEQEWEHLQKTARNLPGLELKRSAPDLGVEMAKVCWAVSHCGYNTAVDVMSTGVSALLVPEENSHGTDQADRLRRMIHWHAARMLMPRHLNGPSLANSIYQLIKFKPAPTDFNLDGAEITANIICELAQSGDGRPVGLSTKYLSGLSRIH